MKIILTVILNMTDCQMDVDVLPTIRPQTPTQIPYSIKVHTHLAISRLANAFFALSQGGTRQYKAEKAEKLRRQNVILLFHKKAGQ